MASPKSPQFSPQCSTVSTPSPPFRSPQKFSRFITKAEIESPNPQRDLHRECVTDEMIFNIRTSVLTSKPIRNFDYCWNSYRPSGIKQPLLPPLGIGGKPNCTQTDANTPSVAPEGVIATVVPPTTGQIKAAESHSITEQHEGKGTNTTSNKSTLALVTTAQTTKGESMISGLICKMVLEGRKVGRAVLEP